MKQIYNDVHHRILIINAIKLIQIKLRERN